MRLSEAILLGLPEIEFTNTFFYHRHADGTCEGCLVGAALVATGRDATFNTFHERWPWTSKLRNFDCPCGIYLRTVFYGFEAILTHLADHYLRKEFTGEQIADLVRAVEPSEASEDTVVPASKVVQESHVLD